MSFRFCTDQKDVAKNVYEVDQELGGGELSVSACAEWGIDLQERKKNYKSPGVCPGGMVTSEVEPWSYKTSKDDLCISGWMDG